jgi:transposase
MKKHQSPLLGVATISMIVARRHLGSYSCGKSKKIYTQPQLMACLILKAYLKQTFRGIVDVLQNSDTLRAAIGLEQVPTFTTLQEFQKRIVTPELLDAILGQVLALCQEQGAAAQEVAVDSTGVETTTASAHFVTRSKRNRKQYVKISLAIVCGLLMPVTMALGMGPTVDLHEAHEVLWKTAGRVHPDFVYMDKGYDCEWIHQFCRDGLKAISYMPPVARTKDGSIRTEYRARCAQYRPMNSGKRWHIESFISGFKRVCGSTLRSRTQAGLLTEAGLKVLAYAIRR